MLRCRFSVSYLPTCSLEAEEGAGGGTVENVSAIRLRKEAKSFSLTREFQDFKVRTLSTEQSQRWDRGSVDPQIQLL